MRSFQFHLQGEHDQQSHAGGQGANVGSEGDSAAPSRSLGERVPLPSRQDLLNSFDPVPETPEVESTFLDHMDEDGNLSPERQAVHDALVESFVTDEDGNPLPSQEDPKALMLGGGAASGKSSAQKLGFVDTPADSVVVNPDEFKVLLPESAGPSKEGKEGNGLADEVGDAWAGITHEESSHLGKRLTSAAMDNSQNIVLDKTSSDSVKAVKQVKDLQARGYDVEVAYVTTEIDQAVENAVRRAEERGRAVPEPVLRKGHVGANQAFLAVSRETSAPTQLLTTTAPNPDGSKNPPILTATSDGSGTITVVNSDAWQAYLRRVPEIPDDLVTRELAAVIVASGGTVVPMMSDDRMKVIYGHVLAGKTPAKMDAEEQEFFDELKESVADMRAKGIAPDFPIDDVFEDDGVVAVTADDDGGEMSARTFRLEREEFHAEHDQSTHGNGRRGGKGNNAKPKGGGDYADINRPIFAETALNPKSGTIFSGSTRLQGVSGYVMDDARAEMQGMKNEGYIPIEQGQSKTRSLLHPTGKIVKSNRTRPALVEFDQHEVDTVAEGSTIVGRPGKVIGKQYALIEMFPEIPDHLGR